jgi:hypothetical protein
MIFRASKGDKLSVGLVPLSSAAYIELQYFEELVLQQEATDDHDECTYP